MEWWKERVVYQIYPRSFLDTNEDGIGDIKGIIQKLDYLTELGVGILWLSPVYASPNKDNGYDISDYYSIHHEFGTMEDMEQLIKEAGNRDIKIIMDLVINHTSTEHEWFLKSRDKNSPYRDYYIWRKGKGNGKLPNNWTSFFGENCWEYDELSDEYYLHLFAKEQADLNFDNPAVIEEIKNIMTFWLDKGIAGFRCDVINVIYKSSLEDGKKKLALTGSEFYISKEGTHNILKQLRKDVLSHYDCFTVGETVFVTPSMGKDLCDKSREELDMIFSFEHMEIDQYFVKWFPRKFSSKRFIKTIIKWQEAIEWNALYFENHDQPRSIHRFINDTRYHQVAGKMLATLLLSLKGTPFIYQGQEIGMTNFDYESLDDIMDVESKNVYALAKKLHIPNCYIEKMIRKASRDNARTPMQWENRVYGGFSKNKPWLKENQNYRQINVDSQIKDKESILNYYKEMIKVRKESLPLVEGEFQLISIEKHLFIYDRVTKQEVNRIYINFCGKDHSINTVDGEVIIGNYKKNGDRILGNKTLILQPYEALIIKLYKNNKKQDNVV